MANVLFGVDGAAIIHEAMSAGLLALTLTKYVTGTRTPGALTAGTNPVGTAYTGKGFTDEYKDGAIDGTFIQRGDRMIVIIANSLSSAVSPEPSDDILIEGATYRIVDEAGDKGGVRRDPFGATYTCQVRLK